MPLPLLVPLLLAGVRTAVPRLVQAGLTLKKAKSVANIIDKAAKKSLLKGKIPTNKTLLNSFNQADKNLLSQSKFTGLLNPTVPGQPINLLGRTPTAATYGQRIGTGGERITIPRRGVEYTQRYSDSGKLLPAIRGSNLPVPVTQNATVANQANVNLSRAAINQQRQASINAQQAAYGQKPITQTADKGMGMWGQAGIIGGLGVAPMLIPNGEQPVQATNFPTGGLRSQINQTPQEPAMRFGEVLRPSSNSTAKEVINASLLRAGLSLMRPTRPGQTPFTQALESAATVADSQNTFRSGKEALEAGQNALGETAKIVVRQNSDGTYNYTGTTDGGIDASTYFGDEDPNAIDQTTLKAFMTQNPTLTREQVIAGLEQKGYTITGE